MLRAASVGLHQKSTGPSSVVLSARTSVPSAAGTADFDPSKPLHVTILISRRPNLGHSNPPLHINADTTLGPAASFIHATSMEPRSDTSTPSKLSAAYRSVSSSAVANGQLQLLPADMKDTVPPSSAEANGQTQLPPAGKKDAVPSPFGSTAASTSSAVLSAARITSAVDTPAVHFMSETDRSAPLHNLATTLSTSPSMVPPAVRAASTGLNLIVAPYYPLDSSLWPPLGYSNPPPTFPTVGAPSLADTAAAIPYTTVANSRWPSHCHSNPPPYNVDLSYQSLPIIGRSTFE